MDARRGRRWVAGAEIRVPGRAHCARVAAQAGFAVGLALVLLGIGCATPGFPGADPSARGDAGSSAEAGRAIRADLGAEYDVLVAETAARDGNFALARQAFERALAKDSASAHLHYRIAHLAVQDEDLGLAIAFAEKGFALAPDDLDGRLFLARLYRLDRR